MQAKALDVIWQGKSTRYSIGADCTIALGGERVELRDLRRGDAVEIAHRSLDRRNAEAMSVLARRAIDRGRWAIVIGMQGYDSSLSRLEYPVADAKLLHDALVGRYRVPDDQVLLLMDENLVRFQQSIPERLGQIPFDSNLLVFFAGHAYKDDGAVYLAAKELRPQTHKRHGAAAPVAGR